MKSLLPTSRLLSLEAAYQPLFCFFVFTLANSLLSYGSFSWAIKFAIGLVGLLFPFLWALASQRGTRLPEASWRAAGNAPFGKIEVWIFLGAMAVRLYQLTSYLIFPLYDEIKNAHYAISLSEKWTWSFFIEGFLPFYIWLLSLGFKVFGVSLTWLWILPALLSLLSAVFFYAAARRFFSPFISMGFLILMSVSFWPVFAGRFSHQALLMGFWESVALGGLAVYIKNPTRLFGKMIPTALGFWVGLGFYTYFGWPLVALLTLITLGAVPSSSTGFKKFQIGSFVSALILVLLPLLLYGRAHLEYLTSLLVFHKNPEILDIWNPWRNIYYVTSFFWKGWSNAFAYKPVWGGFLNPILGSLFFLGVIELYRNRSLPLVRWFFLAFFINFFPILLANNTNWFHAFSLMPLFLLVTAVGLRVLFPDVTGIGPKASLLGLFLVSSILDWTNLERTRDFINNSYPAPEMARVYQQLKQISRERGPGLVFSDLWLRPWPPYLGFATTPFNVLLWKGENLEKGSWCALMANVNYQPFLKKIFPDGKAHSVTKDLSHADGGIMLWIMPATPERLGIFKRWQKAGLALQPFLEQYALLGPNENDHLGPLLDSLETAYPFFQGDSFLESIYWEIRGNIDFRNVLGKSPPVTLFQNQIQGHIPPSLTQTILLPCLMDFQQGIKKGYPAANFYYQLGALESMAGDREKALKYFKKAEECPLDFTDSSKFLGPQGS